MDLLQTPVEELLLRHSIATAAGSLWPWWVAVLTAAVGLLGIRAVVPRSPAPPNVPAVPVEAPKPPPPPAVERPAVCDAECMGSPKARFTAYYYTYEACAQVDVEDEVVGDEVDGDCEREGKGWGLGEDGMMGVKRRWDLGWYRCQEWSAINGSVVRFWAGDGRDVDDDVDKGFTLVGEGNNRGSIIVQCKYY